MIMLRVMSEMGLTYSQVITKQHSSMRTFIEPTQNLNVMQLLRRSIYIIQKQYEVKM